MRFPIGSPGTLPRFPPCLQVLMTPLVLRDQVPHAVPPGVMRESRPILVHQRTSAKRHLASGTHPGGLAADLALRAELAGLGAIFILLSLGNTNGNVLVLLTVMKADLDQILLNTEAVQRGVFHRPGLLSFPRINDVVDFLVSGLSCHREHRMGRERRLLLFAPIALGGVLDLRQLQLQLIIGQDQFVDHGARG